MITHFIPFYSDLSSTSINCMPTEGLNGLEVLRIQNTHSLKQIPSVYNYKVSIPLNRSL